MQPKQVSQSNAFKSFWMRKRKRKCDVIQANLLKKYRAIFSLVLGKKKRLWSFGLGKFLFLFCSFIMFFFLFCVEDRTLRNNKRHQDNKEGEVRLDGSVLEGLCEALLCFGTEV